MQLTSQIARRIIETVGSYGTPPEYGFQFFTAGLEPYLQILREEYLKTYIKEDGGAAVKIVIGTYGGGKTHFLYCLRELAWQENFAVSYVPLSPEETPFYRLESVYRSVINNLTYPLSAQEILQGMEKGVGPFLIAWYERVRAGFQNAGLGEEEIETEIGPYLDALQRGIENTNFAKAVTAAFWALHYGEEQNFYHLLQWLKAEGYDREVHRFFGILSPIDRSNAFAMIRSLVQWIRQIGYSGLVILFDEAEPIASLGHKQRELMLSNLRELIDACMLTSFRHVMVFYAIPDERLLEGPSYIYEALKQRISSVFDFFNPSGVKIELERTKIDPIALLLEIGNKLKNIYEVAYRMKLPQRTETIIATVAEEAYERRFGDVGYLRLFVQNVIRAFHLLRQDPKLAEKDKKIKRMLNVS